MVISKWKYTVCPCRDKPSAEKFSETFKRRAVRYGMSVEKTGGLSNPVPLGTECGDSHIAYLTARGKWVAINYSTNILSRRDRKTGSPCPVRDKMSVENAGCTSNPVPSGTECGDSHIAYLTARGKLVAVNYSTNILSRRDRKTGRPCPVRDKMSVENAGCTSNPVPSGTECGDSHIAYLTARGKWVAVNYSTNILSRRDRKTGRP
ncbi:MAG: hypothetical protein LBJ47_08495, partial [Tannerella sp.]|nr:hypothetical protein [Tannerella sp.]